MIDDICCRNRTEGPRVTKAEGTEELLATIPIAMEKSHAARAAATQAADDRRRAIYEAVDGGATVAQVQRASGLTRARIEAILRDRDDDPRAEKVQRLLNAVEVSAHTYRLAEKEMSEADRNQRRAILAAMDSGIGVSTVQATTGLGRSRINRIREERNI